jgi:hypothetical protein
MEQEGPLNADTMRSDTPNRERCIRTTPANANDGALEGLHALALPLNNPHKHLDRVTWAQLRDIWVSL